MSFVVSDAEMCALYALSGSAWKLYLILRERMDYATGIVGLASPISLSGLAQRAETHVPRGMGQQIVQASQKETRLALDALVRAGLLKREDVREKMLVFRLAKATIGSVRPNQTRHNEGTYRAQQNTGTGHETGHSESRVDIDSPGSTGHENGRNGGTHSFSKTPQTGHISEVCVSEINHLVLGAAAVQESSAAADAAAAPEKRTRLSEAMRQACKRTWDAYALAYAERYGADPVRNAKVSGQIVQLVKRLGVDDAPQVAAYYLTHDLRWYVQVGHSVDALLKDAEKLRTEWATGQRMTSTRAGQIDATQSNLNAINEAKDLAARRRA